MTKNLSNLIVIFAKLLKIIDELYVFIKKKQPNNTKINKKPAIIKGFTT